MHLLHALTRLQRQQVLMKVMTFVDKTGQAQREQRRHPSLIFILPLDRNQRHSHQINGKVGTRMTKQLSNHCGEVTRVGTHGRKAVGKMVTNKITHLQR